MEMRDELLSEVGAQDLDTSSYQVSDLEDVEFNWDDGIFRFAGKKSKDYEKEKASPFSKKCLRQSQSSKSETEPKKPKIIPIMA